MTVSIEELLKAVEYLRSINRVDLKDLIFTENGIPVELDPIKVKEGSFIGLNNVDFITTEYYINGSTEIERC